MRLEQAVKGDIGDTRLVQLHGIVSLDDATSVEAHVWKANSTDKATLTAAVTDPAERTVTVQLGADANGWLAADAEEGTYLFEIEVTFTGGDIRTWPNGTPDELPVRSQGD